MKNLSLKKSGLFLLSATIAMVITSCGGGSNQGGYKSSDEVDRAPYFGIGNNAAKTALENGTRADLNILKPVEILISDDVQLKSYYIEINNIVVAKADNLSIKETTVLFDLKELPDIKNESTFELLGSHIYDAKIVAVDSKDHSTIASFDINTKEFYDTAKMIGSATPNEWDRTKPTPMINDTKIEGRLSWTGHLNAGEIKFATQDIPECWCGIDWIRPATADQSVTDPAYAAFAGDPDYKWKVPYAAEYTIVLDQKTQKMHFGIPAYELGMVGDATQAGWSLDGAVRFERDPVDPGVFTVITPLAATGGEQAIKLFAQPAPGSTSYSYGDGIWIYAPSSKAALPTDVPGAFTLKVGPNTSADDLKWQVTPDKAGTYKITVNFKTQTILFEKQ
jgi:hypothetical protein